jgi:hypothetical protein
MAGEIHRVLAGAAAGLEHVTGFTGKEALQHLPDGLMIAVKGRSIEAAVGLDRPAVLAEFNDIFSHDTLRIADGRFSPQWFLPQKPDIAADNVYALTTYIPNQSSPEACLD